MTAHFELPEPFRDLALPRRDLGAPLPIPKHDPAAAAAAIHATWRGHHQSLGILFGQLGRPSLATDRSLPQTPEEAALQFAAAQSVVAPLVTRLLDAFVDWWVAERNVAFAVATTAGLADAQTAVRRHRKVDGYGPMTEASWYRLRRHVAVMPENELAEVERLLRDGQVDIVSGFMVAVAPHRLDWVANMLDLSSGVAVPRPFENARLLAMSSLDDLRLLKLRGHLSHPHLVPTLLHTFGAALEPWLKTIAAERSPAPEPVQIALEALAVASGTSLPVFIDLGQFDEVIAVDGRVWGDSDLERAIGSLSDGTSHEIVEQLSTFEAARLVDQIFEQWATAGAPENHTWVLDAVGLLGDDHSARSLFGAKQNASLTRQHRDRLLETLLTIDSPTAREVVVTNDVTTRWHRKEPGLAAERLIERMQLPSHDQVLDASVPALGLSLDHPSVLDLGDRQVTLDLDSELAIRLSDESDRLLKTFPRQRSTDDPSAYREAKFRHQEARKQVPRVADAQRSRLEAAMLDCRTWRAEQFRAWFVDHPILRRFVERLLLACDLYENPRLFRVAEDGSFAGRDDGPLDLADDAPVWIHHPMRSTADELSGWRRVFEDYELVQPFAQIDRPAWGPTVDEAIAHAETFVGQGALASKWLDLKQEGFSTNSTGRELNRSDRLQWATLRFDRPGMARIHSDPYVLARLKHGFKGQGANERASELARYLDQVFNS